jgi:Tol biopolymer transport system component
MVLAAALSSLVLGAAAAPQLSYTIGVPTAAYGRAAGVCIGGTRLTDARDDRGVSWSPDGTHFAYTQVALRGDHQRDVVVSDVSGRHVRNLTSEAALGPYTTNLNSDPDWSPDGKQIVYAAGWHAFALEIENADGTGLHSIPNTPTEWYGSVGAPDWSPDGRQIAYVHTGSTGSGVYVIDVDGSNQHLVAEGYGAPDWSPDGRKLAVVDDTGSIVVMNADGSDASSLGVHTSSRPRWSPDGSLLAYADGAGGARRVFVTDLAGDESAVPTPSGFSAFDPAWRTEGAVSARTTGRRCVVRGTSRRDRLVGTSRGDLLLGGGGNDVILGRGGADFLVGGRGRDVLVGGAGVDTIDAVDGRRDTVDGGTGTDRAFYDARRDLLSSIEIR